MCSDQLLKTAKQLRAFCDKNQNHEHINDVTAATQQHVISIINSEPVARRTRSGSASAESVSSYLPEWKTDRSKLQADIRTFHTLVYHETVGAAGSDDNSQTADPNQPPPHETSRPPREPSRPPRNQSRARPSSMANTNGFSDQQQAELTRIIAMTLNHNNAANANAVTAGFSDQQQAELSRIIAMTLNQNNHYQAGQAAVNPAPQNPNTPALRLRDIGYFDPDHDLEAIEVKDNYNVYYNVFSFTNRLKVKVGGSADLGVSIRFIIDGCLLGAAEAWYNGELDDNARDMLRNDPLGISLWCRSLENRFREAPGKALSRLEALRYTTKDVRQHKDPEHYLQQIIIHGKSAGLAATENAQVLMAYEHMDAELRVLLPPPTRYTSMATLLQQVQAQKNNWFDLFKHDKSKDKPRDNYSRGGYINKSFPKNASNRFSNRPFREIYERDYQPERSNRDDRPANLKQDARQPKQEFKRPDRPGIPKDIPRYDYPRRDEPRYPRRGRDDRNYRNDRNYRDNRGDKGKARNYHADEDEDKDQDQEDLDAEWAYQAYKDGFYEGVNYDNSREGNDLNEPNEDDGASNHHDDTVKAHFTLESVDKPVHTCKRCKQTFESNNRLYIHIKDDCLRKKPLFVPAAVTPTPIPVQKTEPKVLPKAPTPTVATNDSSLVVRSTATDLGNTKGYAFRGWRYATAKAKINLESDSFSACLDTGCTTSLIDRVFFHKQNPQTIVETMATPLEVRGIGSDSHLANQYTTMVIYFMGKDGRIASTRKREVHLVDNLKANMLVGVDILAPEGIVIDPKRKTATIHSCDSIELELSIESRAVDRLRRAIFTSKRTVIPPHSRQVLPIQGSKKAKLNLPAGRDFLFEPGPSKALSVFTHIVDHTMDSVFVQNDSDANVVIPQNARIGSVVEYEADGCFVVSPDYSELASKPPPEQPNWVKRSMKGLLTVMALHTSIDTNPTNHGTTNLEPTTNLETQLPNGITIYGGKPTQLAELANSYLIWEDYGNTVKVDENDWMEIPLIDNWPEIYKPGQARVYPVGQRDRDVIDKAFDKLHSQDRMEWTKRATPFTFPCFVVWKHANGTSKGRVVIDIRALNKITLADAYPVPSQVDILAAIKGSTHISTVDCSSFFY